MKDYELKFPVVIDSSMRTDYSSCPRKFYYRHLLGLQSLGVNIHLNAGGAYADAMEVFRKAFYGDDVSFEDAQALGVLALIKTYGDPDFEPSEAKQWYRMIDAFLSYLATYPPATDYVKPYMEKGNPAVEYSFALPVDDEHLAHPDTDDPLLFVGRFDMLAMMNGTMFVLDDKTTSRLGQQWSMQWDLRSQFTGYCWGAQQFGHPVGGAIIRGTAILKTKITHAEAIVYRPQFMIDRWKKRLVIDCTAMVDAYMDLFIPTTDETGKLLTLDDCFPCLGEESGACASYSGCSYKMLCESPNPENWVEGNFEVNRWDPTRGAGDVK
jgi:hypothetical protein